MTLEESEASEARACPCIRSRLYDDYSQPKNMEGRGECSLANLTPFPHWSRLLKWWRESTRRRRLR